MWAGVGVPRRIGTGCATIWVRARPEIDAMAHPHTGLVGKAYEALNRHEVDGFVSAFAPDAVLHGTEGRVAGRESIRTVIEQLIALSQGTLQIIVHDILANDDHTVVLQTTTAQLGDRQLEDHVVYSYHIEDGLIKDAYFTGDPRVQAEFYGLN
jgi:hypothetical protein